MSQETQERPLPPDVTALIPEISSWSSGQQFVGIPDNPNIRIARCTDAPQCVQDLVRFGLELEHDGRSLHFAILQIDGPVTLDAGWDQPPATGRLSPRNNAIAQMAAESDKNFLCEFCARLPFHRLGLTIMAKSPLEIESVNVSGLTKFLGMQSLESLAQNARACVFCKIIASRSWNSLADTGEVSVDDDLDYVYRESTISEEAEENCDRLYTLTRLIVELHEIIPNSSTGKRIIQSIQFQRYSRNSAILSCDASTLFPTNCDESHLYEGRIRPENIQFHLLRAWKDHCQKWHGQCSEPAKADRHTNLHLRLVDVDRKCIVNSSGLERWVALSYVWGNSNRLVVTKRNINKYREPGSLHGVTSATIDDAITVTQSLGERYLWVDCLCILQDCPKDKFIHIPQMGLIYSEACLTIISASGTNAEAGLPGVRPLTRELLPSVYDYGDYPFIMTMDPIYSRQRDCTSGSVWSTRAWTLQERLLSRRVLVFTPALIYWECQMASWSEDTFQEVAPRSPLSLNSCFGDNAFWPHHCLSNVLRSQPLEVISLYRQIASHYTQLHLSLPEDSLNAISGTLRFLEDISGCKFFWALPIQYLSSALAWETYSDGCGEHSPRNRRKKAIHSFTDKGGRARLCRFPSWSWVGWKSRIWYPPSEDNALDHSVSPFYYIIEGKPPTLLSDSFRQRHELGPFWKRPGWNVSGETLLEPNDVPSDIPFRPLNAGFLGFWTDTAWVDLHWENTEAIWTSHYHDSKVRAEISSGGTTIFSRWNQLPAYTQPYSKQEAFLVVIGAKRFCDQKTEMSTQEYRLSVLLVALDNGIAYRRGLCQIEELDWITLPARQWKPVFLG